MGRGKGVISDADGLFRMPVYKQLQQIFLGLIKSGAWLPNRPLPNEIVLANEYGVSVGTIRKVIDELCDLRLVTRFQGRGTFVNDTGRSITQAIFDPIRTKEGSLIDWDPLRIEQEFGAATPQERQSLGRDTSVIRLSWVRSANQRVLAYQLTVIPADIGIDGTRTVHISGLGEIYARAGIFVERSEEEMIVKVPPATVAQRMRLLEQMPIQHVACRYFDDFGSIIGASSMWLRLGEEHVTCSRSVRRP